MIFCYYVSALGLGYFLSILIKSNKNEYGINAYLGFAVLPLFLIFSNLICSIPLNVASLTIFFISLIGCLLFGKNVFNDFRNFMSHPLFAYVFPVSVIYLVCHNNYAAHSWDEFSHWITMPKQIFLHKSITSDGFLVNNFASYTPSWPLLLIFKDLIISKSLDIGSFLYVPLFSGLLLICVLFDIIERIIKSRLGAWLFILFIPVIGSPLYPYHDSILIEFPMQHALIVITALLYFSCHRYDGGISRSIQLGVLLAYSYTLKHSFMTLFPVLLFFFMILLYLKRNDHENTIVSTYYVSKRELFSFLCLVVPYFIFYAIWQMNLGWHGFTQGYSPIDSVKDKDLLVQIMLRAKIIYQSVLKVCFFDGWKQVISIVTLIVSYIKFRQTRFIISFVAVYYIFYYLCLLWMYLTVFSEYEALQLSSFDRFMSIPLSGIYSIAICLFGYFAYVSSVRWTENRITRARGKHVVIALLVFFILLNVNYYQRQIRSVNVKKLPISVEAERLVSYIKQLGYVSPEVLIVAQGGDRFEYHVANFESIGDDRYWFRPLPNTSWGETSDNLWRTVVTTNEMRQRLGKTNIIWVVKSDLWADNVLSSLPYNRPCSSPYDQYFVIRNKDGSFNCLKKFE